MVVSLIRKIVPARWRPVGYLYRKTFVASGGRVVTGPFAGLKYINNSYGSCYVPKLLGIYERELHAEVEEACAAKPALIVDIGAAEGYYAVGLARRLPNARVLAFEMSDEGRSQIMEMVKINDCQNRIEIRGKCETADLQTALAGGGKGALVVCDCEGYENILLDPATVPALKQAMMLVELHDIFEPGTAERITERFAPTHDIQRIWSIPRDPSEYPYRSTYLRLLPRRYMEFSVSEWRPAPMSWLWMKPMGS
ncbi:MAG: hypothetical protein M3O30_18495 [Planctomycetota bacterium]|nr:hypothetical protein [Planctomycetota bacterium]